MVNTFNTRTGDVVLLGADVTSAVQDLTVGGAPTFAGLSVGTFGGPGGTPFFFSTQTGTAVFSVQDTNSSSETVAFDIIHRMVSGSAAAGIGAQLTFTIETGGGNVNLQAAVIAGGWSATGSTSASNRGYLRFTATASVHAKEFLRGQATGANSVGIGFFGVSVVNQQTAGGVTAGYTPGISTPVTIDGTFTGNVGSTAYTLADVIAAMKNYGLLVT